MLAYVSQLQLTILFLPCCPKTTARLEMVVVFPITWICRSDNDRTNMLSTDVNSIFVRMLRYCSVIRDLGSLCVINCLNGFLFFLPEHVMVSSFQKNTTLSPLSLYARYATPFFHFTYTVNFPITFLYSSS